MKVIRFVARRVHGHYNFDFEFNPDVTFLVGINGSGKTSALRLMQAAISCDLSTLCAIRFSELHIAVERDRLQKLSIFNEGSSLRFELNGDEANTKVLLLSDDERSMYQKSGRLVEYMEEIRLKFLKDAGEPFRRFANGPRPLFLGLERRMGRYDDETFYYPEDEMAMRAMRTHSRPFGEFVEGIDHCKILIERAYRQFRRSSDMNNSRLINVIVESTFDYIEFDPTWVSAKNSYLELQSLVTRRKEIERFARELGGGDKASSQIGGFFSRISDILNDAAGKKNDALHLELLLNKAQIQRIHKILAEMDRQKKMAERYYAPIKSVTDALNEFFSQSNKTVEIDSVGRIKVSHAGNPIPLEHLSSGEKQLLILLTHARFSRNRGGAFIVDEPELSLHMRWQEMLVDGLLDGGPSNNQFIFATHSPEIVGYRKHSCIRVD